MKNKYHILDDKFLEHFRWSYVCNVKHNINKNCQDQMNIAFDIYSNIHHSVRVYMVRHTVSIVKIL